MHFTLSQESRRHIQGMAVNGERVSAILRYLIRECQIKSPIELALCMVDVFNIDFNDAHCISGWWEDGSLELSDDEVEAMLAPKIREAEAEWLKEWEAGPSAR